MTKHRVSNLLRAIFQRVAQHLNVLRPKRAHNTLSISQHFENQSVAQSVAVKTQSTQWLGGGRNTATLLLSKININVHMYTCMHVYRGSNRSVFEVLRPRPVLSVARSFMGALFPDLGRLGGAL